MISKATKKSKYLDLGMLATMYIFPYLGDMAGRSEVLTALLHSKFQTILGQLKA